MGNNNSTLNTNATNNTNSTNNKSTINNSNTTNNTNAINKKNNTNEVNNGTKKDNNLLELKDELMMEIDPKVNIYPFIIDNKEKVKYEKYSKIGCFKTQEKEVFCKHIHNNILSDLITFNLDDCLEKNAEEILKNREILDLRLIPGLKDYSKEEKIEYYKNKLFIEPYIDETMEENNSNLIENLDYFMKLKNFYSDDGEVKTICEIMKNNGNQGTISLGYMQDNNDEDIIFLQKNNQIYIRINNNKELIFSILDEKDNILSEFPITDKIEEEFGEDINCYLSTNNKNIFENPFYTENLNGVVVPYLSKIDINFLD